MTLENLFHYLGFLKESKGIFVNVNPVFFLNGYFWD